MKKQELLSGRNKELFNMAEQFEKAQQENRHIYLDADDWADLADWYAIANKKKQALDAATYGLNQHPNNTALQVELAYLYLDDNQLQKAFSIANAIEEGDLAEVKILKATLYMKNGEDWKTHELLDSLEEKMSLPNIIEVAYLFIEAGSPDLALPWLELGKGKYDNDECFLAVCADYNFAINNLEESKRLLNELIDKNPYAAPYWYNLAKCYLEENQLDKAIEAAEFALVSDEDFGEAYLLLANSYYMLGNEEKAQQCFDKAVDLHAVPKEVEDTVCYTKLMANGMWKEAYSLLLKTLDGLDQTTPNGKHMAATILASMVQCLIEMGKTDDAYTLCLNAINIDPSVPDNYIILGVLRAMKGNLEEANTQWEKALDLSADSKILWQTGMWAIEFESWDIAKRCFEQLATQLPNLPKLNENLTLIYLATKDLEKFKMYNQQCENPIDANIIEKYLKQIDSESQEKLAKAIQEITKLLNL